jgi:hypothetical protein
LEDLEMRYSPRSLTATALVAAAASPALAQWSSDPAANTPVVTTPAAQTVTKSAVAADGSSWMGWFDFNAPSIQVRVQRLDATGQRTFSPEGLLVSDEAQNTSVVDWDMRVDSQGNCMLAFVDIRDGGDNDVHAYLIAPDGTMLWGETGVTVSDNAEFEADPRIVQLSGGDYAVVWPRFDVNPGLVMQRISPAGVKAFGGDGVLIISSGTEEPAFVEVEPTSDNGFMIAYVRNIASFLSPRHIRAQKFNADGQPQWGASPVIVSQATAVPIAHRPRLLNDGADGAVIAWHDTRDGDFDCYLQRITPAGATVFAAQRRRCIQRAAPPAARPRHRDGPIRRCAHVLPEHGQRPEQPEHECPAVRQRRFAGARVHRRGAHGVQQPVQGSAPGGVHGRGCGRCL